MGQIPAFYFDELRLDGIASARADEFGAAAPFPHVVVDDFVPASILDQLIGEFPPADDARWTQWGPHPTSVHKLGRSRETDLGPFTRHFLGQLVSATFVAFLEKLTGIDHIIVDPTFNGCGLHSTGRDGRLMVHTDTNRHPHSAHRLHQVLNFILFLNRDWREEYGGHLEFWSEASAPCARILPVANRAVLFETGTRSFHGHPQPLRCPRDRRRNSIAVYYYALDRRHTGDDTGLQPSVRWMPSTAGDRNFVRRQAIHAQSIVAKLHGARFRAPAGLLPLGKAQVEVSLLVFCWSRLPSSERTQIEAAHLSRIDAAIPAACTPFAIATSPAAKGPHLLLLSAEDASVHVCRPDARTPLFVGYFTDLLSPGD